MSIQENLDKLEQRITDQDGRLRVLETYVKAAVIVALVFGIGGAWGTTVVSKARTTITELDERLGELNKRTSNVTEQVDTSVQEITKAKDVALADFSTQVPVILKSAKALRHCRICYQVVGSDGGTADRQCIGQQTGCSAWSDTPNWSSTYNDDTDARGGWCSMSWKLECE